jgi:hypothetical protein
MAERALTWIFNNFPYRYHKCYKCQRGIKMHAVHTREFSTEESLSVSGLKRVRLRDFFLLIIAYGVAGRKKIVRLKEGSACEECPLRENTLYYIPTYEKKSPSFKIARYYDHQCSVTFLLSSATLFD